MKRTLLSAVLMLLLANPALAQRTWQLQGHQERGEGGRNAVLRCDGLKLNRSMGISRVECSSAGFWVSDGAGNVIRFDDPQSALGSSLGPGKVWVYPNLPPHRTQATVTLFLTLGGGTSGGGGGGSGGFDWIGGTSWRVGSHPVPWTFRGDGTVSAGNLWEGTWTAQGDAIAVRIVQQGVSDAFTVKFSPDRQSLTAYKNDQVYRRGRLAAGATPTPTSYKTPVREEVSGDWALQVDQFSAELRLRGGGGKIFFHAVGRWEPVDSVSWNGSELTFRRPEYNQVYQGRLVRPGRLEGKYLRRPNEYGEWSGNRMK